MLPTIVSRRSPLPARGGGSLLHVAGSQRWCLGSERRSRATIPFSSMSRFSLDLRESKPKFLSPNSFSFMAEITPHHYESCCGNTRDVREPEAFVRISVEMSVYMTLRKQSSTMSSTCSTSAPYSAGQTLGR